MKEQLINTVFVIVWCFWSARTFQLVLEGDTSLVTCFVLMVGVAFLLIYSIKVAIHRSNDQKD